MNDRVERGENILLLGLASITGGRMEHDQKMSLSKLRSYSHDSAHMGRGFPLAPLLV